MSNTKTDTPVRERLANKHKPLKDRHYEQVQCQISFTPPVSLSLTFARGNICFRFADSFAGKKFRSQWWPTVAWRRSKAWEKYSLIAKVLRRQTIGCSVELYKVVGPMR